MRKLGLSKTARRIALVLILLSLVGVAYAAAYTILQYTITATVEANPAVTFFQWSTGTKYNTFDYGITIFPSLRTIDENITHGVWDWESGTHTCYIRVESLTNTANIDYLNCTIYNSTTQLVTQKWTDFSTLPTSWSPSFTTMYNFTYTMWIEINATSSASGSSVFTMNMEVENP
ncbi:MAG: hypothetical protein JSV85_03530 [Candidatus Bathyarchaeota archaeon]|nr:MAG: hypothetical protein JSV85_03530 [Candidatus Bathyarchaeota archaeon]